MNDAIYDAIALAVECFLAAILIMAISNFLSVADTLNQTIAEQEADSATMQEYRIHNQYDNTHVYSQDIVSAVLKYRGDIKINVSSSKGTVEWSGSTQSTVYMPEEVTVVIDQNVVYDSTLVKGVNGDVIGYSFVPHVNGCGR